MNSNKNFSWKFASMFEDLSWKSDFWGLGQDEFRRSRRALRNERFKLQRSTSIQVERRDLVSYSNIWGSHTTYLSLTPMRSQGNIVRNIYRFELRASSDVSRFLEVQFEQRTRRTKFDIRIERWTIDSSELPCGWSWSCFNLLFELGEQQRCWIVLQAICFC